MSFIRTQVTLPTDSALPADSIVNTFHFDADNAAITSGDLDAIRDRLTAFYTSLTVYFSTLITGQVQLRYYDLEEGQPRTPIRLDTFNIAPDGGPSFPADVAVCLSYQAALISGESPRRRRGRIYFGHPSDATRGPVIGSDLTVHVNARTALANACDVLATAPDPKWAVFSPTTAGPPAGPNGAYTAAQLGPAFNDVQNGWVDDRYDTQRRRGSKPTTRTVWSA